MKSSFKKLAIVLSVTLLAACQSTPEPEPMVIPIQLVNYNPPMVIAPDRPDATAVKAIEASDTPESALDTLINYLGEVGEYVVTIEDQNNELQNQKATFKANQTKIKQVILMSQP